MEPMVLARLLQSASISADDVVLEIGCGTGYGAAVLSRLAGTVVSLEVDEALATEASATLRAVGADNAIVVTGPLEKGYSRQAPYDAVVFSGAIPAMPDAIAEQLGDGGRAVGVLHEPGKVGVLTLWAKYHDQLSSRPVANASVPMLPGFAKPEMFEFGAS
jgi:protein-L-isoaspartate(D-aspartate) O-methyltransferase